MRRRLYEVIEVSQDNDKLSHVYDMFMMIIIIVSIIPLAFKTTNPTFEIIDKVAAVIFIIDYLFRWFTSDYKLKKGIKSYFLYPFTFMAIIDLVTILPSITVISSGFRMLKIVRLFRTLKVLRVFKSFRYSKNIQVILSVLKKQKDSLLAVCILAIGYVLVAALIILNVEPDSFNNYFDALYWATVSLTTMGYGDIYPISVAGRLVTMVSSFMGIAIIALPSGIITSGFMEELNKNRNK